ncbi:MBOAT family O-acyltransferase [Helcococcus kunzii]|uniref:MBOAT family O-acyltransferase n=2 Tax=Helcococcus kunzii TaxID=40091 RepID=UPI001BB0A5AB|nr:MBOAT family protein [Helcococcus kunzii]QUY65321.1 MBOAT family protein [Helcococcus kunzii]
MSQIFEFFLDKDKQSLISFFSVEYMIILLPMVFILVGITPKRYKRYTLLALSYLYYWWISRKLIVVLIGTTLIMYFAGLFIEKIYGNRDKLLQNAEKSQKKEIRSKFNKKSGMILVLSISMLVLSIVVFKYLGFFTRNLNYLLKGIDSGFRLKIPRLMVPIGISFFTLQSISYLVDVKREVIKADHNIFRLALFISYFPQIVEGPICRYADTASQLWNVTSYDKKNLKYGAMRYLYGIFKKIVIADRLNIIVSKVFNKYDKYSGWILLVGIIAYTIQLYMDFSGSMDAVLGTSEMLGIRLTENFRRPLFSRSISEFWTRWHISLGTWFKDYIFYPITMSSSMKKLTSNARKKIGNHFGPLLAGGVALFCVWLLNGLWHGAGWTFIAFGMYHFILIYTASLLLPFTNNILTKLKINTSNKYFKIMQIIRTFFLVVIGELFFRAPNIRVALSMIKRIFTKFYMPTSKPFYSIMETPDIVISIISILIVFCISLALERGVNIRDRIFEKNIVYRWIIIYAIILFIIIFGAYGYGYTPIDPMYANY